MQEIDSTRPAKRKVELLPALQLLAVACGLTTGSLAALTGSLLTTIVPALGITLLLWKPLLGLIAFLFMVPFEELTTFGLTFTAVRVVGMVTFTCWFFKIIWKRQIIGTDLLLWIMLLFGTWSASSLLWGIDRNNGIVAVSTLVQLILLYLMSCNLIKSNENLRTAMASYVSGAVVATIIAVLGVYGSGFLIRASVSDMQDPNHFARVLCCALIMAVYLACTSRGLWCCLYFTGSVLLVWGVLLSGSRGAWLAILVSVVAAAFCSKSKKLKITLLTCLITVILFFNNVIIKTIPTVITERVSSVSVTDLADRGSGRLDIWMVGMEMVKKNWLAGAGINSFLSAYNDYIFKASDEIKDRGVNRDAHNTFLCILAELGFLGFSLFCLFWVVTWKSVAGLTHNNEKTFGISMLIYLFFANLTGTEYMNKYFWIGLTVVQMMFLTQCHRMANVYRINRKEGPSN